MAQVNYPELRKRLQSLSGRLARRIPDTMKGFSALHSGALAEGSLNKATKELIAVGIAVAGHCQGCIAFHVKGALSAGATAEQIEETIGVAVLMGGGPAMIYGCEALDALEQYTSA